MLSRLYIKNVALISEADITFDSGLNVLSGETGSGKSVILDSINFVLGSKADKNMIRYGENEAVVKAEFVIDENAEAKKVLEDFDVESDGEIIITRKYSVDGKGSIKINGNAATGAMLKTLTQHLVDVHGQSEHFFLLSEENQLKVLDGLLGKSATDIKESIAKKLADKKRLNLQIESIGGNEAERERKIDLLKFQIDEIKKADLKAGEFSELKAKQSVISNVEKILNALNATKSALSDDNACLDAISSAQHGINQISNFSDDYSNLASRLENLYAEADDISQTIGDLAENLSFDSREAEEIDSRIDLIKSLFKKYGTSESDVLEFLDKAQLEYEFLSNSTEILDDYKKQLEQVEENVYKLCKNLTELRQGAAKTFCRNVTNQLKTLNIPDARFEINFAPYDVTTANLNSANGSDKVSFMFSANKGEPLKPLNKVISGGEMSRFMLSIKTCLKDVNGISTYIFDEIDAGISGLTAVAVAEKFVDISKKTQILAVSHLPQVCAASSAQFLIYKAESDGKTKTHVKRLTETEKVDEIVRLTGSIASESATKHAIELINKFKR